MRRPLPNLLLFGCLGTTFALLSSCAAGRSTYFLINAEREYQNARAEDAETKAIYEITLASEYLRKAKEENGYADYGASERLAKTSMQHAQKALEQTSMEQIDSSNEEFVPEEKKDDVKPVEKDNTLDDIDLDEL